MDTPFAKKLLITAITLIVAMSAVSAISAPTSAATVSQSLGSFSMSYETTNSTIYNINYSNPNYTVNVADSVLTAGKNAAVSEYRYADVSKTITLANVTLFATEDQDMLMLATTNSTTAASPSVTFNLPSAATAISLSSTQKSILTKTSNPLMISFLNNQMYRISVTDGYVYYMANSPSTLINGGKTIVFQNSTFVQGSSLVVATTPSGTIKLSLDKQLNNYNLSINPLTYSSSTGDVTGTYLSMNFNTNSGIISNYRNIYTDTVVFNSIYSYGNGTFGNGFTTPSFPNVTPSILGSVFYYANSTSIYIIHNNIATLGKFFLSNGTTVMKVNSALNITMFHPGSNSQGKMMKYGNNYSNFSNMNLGNQYMVQAAPTIITLHNSDFTGQLFVHSGTVAVNGHTISISTTDFAYATFVAQNLFLHANLQLRNQLQYALQHGNLGAIVSVGPMGPTGNNITTYYNSTMQVTVQNAYTNRVQVQMESQKNHGTSVAIFIPNDVIKNTSRFTLRFDNQQMTQLNDMNGVLNSTNQNQAQYYMTAMNGGTLVIVHSPHFSTHTLEITASGGTVGLSDTLLYVIIGVVVVVAAGILVYGMTRRTRKT